MKQYGLETMFKIGHQHAVDRVPPRSSIATYRAGYNKGIEIVFATWRAANWSTTREQRQYIKEVFHPDAKTDALIEAYNGLSARDRVIAREVDNDRTAYRQIVVNDGGIIGRCDNQPCDICNPTERDTSTDPE